MTIAVIDQGTELYWFVRKSLASEEFSLKHLLTPHTAEEYISNELPALIILNGDDSLIDCIKLITKIRNHVFGRNTFFIVVTSDPSLELKKSLLIAGASEIFYKEKGVIPSSDFFKSIVKWLLSFKTNNSQKLEFKPVDFLFKGQFTTFGRIGWISKSECYLENSLELEIGQIFEIQNLLFDQLEIKNAKITILGKNTSGRYYQYSNGYHCRIDTLRKTEDSQNLSAWIKNNQKLSKYKPIKLLYYEPNSEMRDSIKQMIKLDQRYCARGFSSFDEIQQELNYHMPHFLLIDRQLISHDRSKFEQVGEYLKNHFCYCVTYDNSGMSNIEEFKQDFNFAMHLPKFIDNELLESMVKKLEEKLFKDRPDDSKEKIFFNKYSDYSRVSLSSECQIIELAKLGIGFQAPFEVSPFCAFEIIAQGFTHLSLNRKQYFRNCVSKRIPAGVYSQCVFFGQTISEQKIINVTIQKIEADGFVKWKDEH